MGVDSLAYVHAEITYKKYVDVALHYNTEWTADPNLTQQDMPGPSSYTAAQQANLSVGGGEVNLRDVVKLQAEIAFQRPVRLPDQPAAPGDRSPHPSNRVSST